MRNFNIIKLLALIMLSGGCLSGVGAQPSEESGPAANSPYQEPPPLVGTLQQSSDMGLSNRSAAPDSMEILDRAPAGRKVQMISGQEPEMERGYGQESRSGAARIHNERGIRYVSGGIGEGDRDALNTLSGQFNLRLLFAVQTGNYLADTRVKITNAHRETVLDALSEGPWFFAQLPPGSYTVEVDAIGQVKKQNARIDGNRQASLKFFWR